LPEIFLFHRQYTIAFQYFGAGTVMKNNIQINKICIYGVGGVGGFFGGKIANAINLYNPANRKIFFIARGEHKEVIKRDGIKLITTDETIVGIPAQVTDDINEVQKPDLFLLCVKSYDLDDVVDSIRSKVNQNTIILPLLNGADIYDRIRANLNDGIVLPACVFVGTHIQKPGVISQIGGDGKILFGKDPKFSEFNAERVLSFFDDMGIYFQWNDDPFPAIWQKYMFIASFGLVTVFTGKTLGEIMDDEKAKALVSGIMGEINTIAQAKKIVLPENIIAESINKAKNFPYDTKTSYQRDVEAKGPVNEGDLYGGMIIRQGDELGIPTPVTKEVYTKIQDRLAG
jgi:2-dehydropantoate 2-reductase